MTSVYDDFEITMSTEYSNRTWAEILHFTQWTTKFEKILAKRNHFKHFKRAYFSKSIENRITSELKMARYFIGKTT